MDQVTEVFDKLGVRGVRPLRRTLIVRTNPLPQKTESGLIWLPSRSTSFYGGLPHMVLITALVLAAGPKCTVKVGETVIFQRLHFTRWVPYTTDTFVGWIDESQLVGYPQD